MKYRLLINYFIFLSVLGTLVVLFGGCACKETTPKTVYVHSTCPVFYKKFDIDIIKHNNKEARVSWEDVQELKDFSKAQSEFNTKVKEMNQKNKENVKESLKTN